MHPIVFYYIFALANRNKRTANMLSISTEKMDQQNAPRLPLWCIHGLASLIAADPGDLIAAERNIALHDLAGIHVDDLTVPDDRVGGDAPRCHVDQMRQLFPRLHSIFLRPFVCRPRPGSRPEPVSVTI